MASKTGIRPLVAGNWKMNGLQSSLGEAQRVRERLGEPGFAAGVDVMICPPATLIGALARDAAGSRLQVGAQDCHGAASGAHTGDVAAEMLKDAGASAVIVGHSERRADHGEGSRDVRAKALAAHRAGLMGIVCVGETAGERAAGLTLTVVGAPTRGFAARWGASCRHGGGLRAGLGDRHRAHRRRYRTLPRYTHSSVARCSPGSAPKARACAFSTAARSSPTTRGQSSAWLTSTARWWEEQASRPPTSSLSLLPPRLDGRPKGGLVRAARPARKHTKPTDKP